MITKGLHGNCYVEDSFMYKGYECVVLVNSVCVRNGYVGVPKEHPLYNVDYSKIEGNFDVHGGLTFSNKSADDNYWFFGFDTGHFNDRHCVEDAIQYGVINQTKAVIFEQINIIIGEGSGAFEGKVRDFDYVRGEVIKLADQLKEVENEKGELE